MVYCKWHIEQAKRTDCIGIGAVNKNKSMQKMIRRCISQMEYKMGNVSTMSENLIKYLNAVHWQQKHAKSTGAASTKQILKSAILFFISGIFLQLDGNAQYKSTGIRWGTP